MIGADKLRQLKPGNVLELPSLLPKITPEKVAMTVVEINPMPTGELEIAFERYFLGYHIGDMYCIISEGENVEWLNKIAT